MFRKEKKIGDTGHRSQDLLHAKQTLYHWATSPVSAFSSDYKPLSILCDSSLNEVSPSLHEGTLKPYHLSVWGITEAHWKGCSNALALHIVNYSIADSHAKTGPAYNWSTQTTYGCHNWSPLVWGNQD